MYIYVYSEEVLLENVELTLQAFDYLQLPFALKQGSSSVCVYIYIYVDIYIHFQFQSSVKLKY